MLANQRNELVCCDQKCDCIDKSKQSQNDKSRQPIGISQLRKIFGECLRCWSSRNLLSSTRTELQRSTRINNPKPVACSRALTLSVMRFSFPAFSQGSSVVEQGTHKPLVGSSTLPPGTILYGLGLYSAWDERPPLHWILCGSQRKIRSRSSWSYSNNRRLGAKLTIVAKKSSSVGRGAENRTSTETQEESSAPAISIWNSRAGQDFESP